MKEEWMKIEDLRVLIEVVATLNINSSHHAGK